MSVRILVGDCRERLAELPDESVACVVTSPPFYGLRDYQAGEREIGREATPAAYVAALVEVFRAVRRVLRRDGTCWLNLGSSFASQPFKPWGIKPKDELMIPHRVAMALVADGWYLRQAITLCKTAPMPESVGDRPTSATEMLFLLTRSPRYWYDAEAVRVPCAEATVNDNRVGTERVADFEQAAAAFGAGTSASRRAARSAVGSTAGRNLWSWWLCPPSPFTSAGLGVTDVDHFAVMPIAAVEPCVKAGCPPKACSHCGTGWRRVVERTSTQNQAAWSGAGRQNGCMVGGGHFGRTGQWSAKTRTLDWQPACTCPPHEPVPGTVLDPFFGAGTTGLVADRLGRDAIGIELNEQYAALARRRIEAEAGLFAQVEVAR